MKHYPLDATWVKTNPKRETIEGCKPAEQGTEKQQNADRKTDPLDVTWLKTNSTGETIERCKPAEHRTEKQQNANGKTVAARPWRAAFICLTLCSYVCAALFIFVNAAWLYSTYFPPRCVTAPALSSSNSSASEHEDWLSNVDLSGGLPSLDPEINETSEVQFVQKREWSALSTSQAQEVHLRSPVRYVIVSQTFTNDCSSFKECSFQVRFIQHYQMQNMGWTDIIYNFLIGGDGRVYVGRGWDIAGGHTIGYNDKSIGVSFIGMFDKTQPSEAQLDALRAVIDNGIETGKLTPDCKLFARRQLLRNSALNPGDALYSAIKALHRFESPFIDSADRPGARGVARAERTRRRSALRSPKDSSDFERYRFTLI